MLFFFSERVFSRDIELVNGKIYKNIKITKQYPNSISILHDNGISKLFYKNMTDKDRKFFGYNTEKAKVYDAKMKVLKIKRLAKKKTEEKLKAKRLAILKKKKAEKKARLKVKYLAGMKAIKKDGVGYYTTKKTTIKRFKGGNVFLKEHVFLIQSGDWYYVRNRDLCLEPNKPLILAVEYLKEQEGKLAQIELYLKEGIPDKIKGKKDELVALKAQIIKTAKEIERRSDDDDDSTVRDSLVNKAFGFNKDKKKIKRAIKTFEREIRTIKKNIVVQQKVVKTIKDELKKLKLMKLKALGK